MIEYKIEAQLELDQAEWDKQIFQRSLFILGTNQVIDYWEDQEEFADLRILKTKLRTVQK